MSSNYDTCHWNLHFNIMDKHCSYGNHLSLETKQSQICLTLFPFREKLKISGQYISKNIAIANAVTLFCFLLNATFLHHKYFVPVLLKLDLVVALIKCTKRKDQLKRTSHFGEEKSLSDWLANIKRNSPFDGVDSFNCYCVLQLGLTRSWYLLIKEKIRSN